MWTKELFPDKEESSFINLRDIEQENVEQKRDEMKREMINKRLKRVGQTIVEKEGLENPLSKEIEKIMNKRNKPEVKFPVYTSDSIQTQMFTSTISA
jgi:hypothetical protein